MWIFDVFRVEVLDIVDFWGRPPFWSDWERPRTLLAGEEGVDPKKNFLKTNYGIEPEDKPINWKWAKKKT